MLSLDWLIKRKEKKCIYWWEPSDGSINAGDHLSKIIVQQMLLMKDKNILDKKNSENKLLAIGSVMHFAKNNDCIWGTGINGKISHEELKFKTLDVRAVRGPNTRSLLMKLGIQVPEVYGDPGLLLPYFFTEKTLLINSAKKKDYIIIPHMNEDFDLYKKFGDNLCSPRQGAISFTREIVNSKFVISSSLHGVIIAEAYGIPAVLLQNTSGETRFKYDDYYLGSGRDNYSIAQTVDEAFNTQPAQGIDFHRVTMPLFNSFPYDLWV